jgi:hypothetical protein
MVNMIYHIIEGGVKQQELNALLMISLGLETTKNRNNQD